MRALTTAPLPVSQRWKGSRRTDHLPMFSAQRRTRSHGTQIGAVAHVAQTPFQDPGASWVGATRRAQPRQLKARGMAERSRRGSALFVSLSDCLFEQP